MGKKMKKILVTGGLFGLFLATQLVAGETVTSLTAPSTAAHPAGSCAEGDRPFTIGQPRLQQVELQLAYVGDFKSNLSFLHVTVLSGRCAAFVTASKMGLLGLSNGDAYQIRPDATVVPWNPAFPLFERPKLDHSEIPRFRFATFVHAEKIASRQTQAGLTKRYIGLWKEKAGWLVAEFTVPAGEGKAGDARPLLRSRLPLRSVSFFPAIDTPSGSLFLVQEGKARSVRLIRLDWEHG